MYIKKIEQQMEVISICRDLIAKYGRDIFDIFPYEKYPALSHMLAVVEFNDRREDNE